MTRDGSAVALVSASLLAYEVSLVRVVAVTHEYHLAPVVIAVALLGFGLAGSAAALAPPGARALRAMAAAALLTALLVPVCVGLSGRVPLRLPALAWRSAEIGHLALYALAFLPPFFTGALVITMALQRAPEAAGRLYGASLLGSAAGAVGVLPLFDLLGLDRTLVAGAGPAAAAGVLLWDSRRGRVAAALFFLAVGVGLAAARVPSVRPSEDKPLAARLHVQGAETWWEHDSAVSRLTVVTSPALHSIPGLSLESRAASPLEWALFRDGDAETPLFPVPPEMGPETALTQVLDAAPFAIRPRASVLVLGAGGGWEAWVARANGARDVDLVDVDQGLVALLSAGFLPHPAWLRLGDPRHVAARARGTHDIVFLEARSPASGTAAAQETYGLTVEAFTAYLERLRPGGLLAVSAPVEALPRDALRLAATAVAVLARRGSDPAHHVACLRDWGRMILLVGRDPLSEEDIAGLRSFAEFWSFDLVALPGLRPEETNRWHVREEARLEESFAALLGFDRRSFLDRYVFDVRPVTDDRPFFHRTFRWSSRDHLRATVGTQWPRHVGWGYLLLWAAVPVVMLLAAPLVLVPAVLLARRGTNPGLRPFVYFAAIGAGFMGLEIALLGKAALLLGSPTASVGVVLAAVLVGAGLGSLAAPRAARRVPVLTLLVGVGGLGAVLLLQALAGPTAGWTLAGRALVVAAIAAGIAFPMGMPMPFGLTGLGARGPAVVAWAWGVNGYASVVGTLLASLLAMHLGLRGLALCAGGCYWIAGMASGFVRGRK